MKHLLTLIPMAIFLQSCQTSNFYLKTVAAKDAKITNEMKMAVIPENGYWKGVPSFLPRALVTEFMDLGFTVVERSQLDEIFKELKLDASGAIGDGNKSKDGSDVEYGVLDKTSIKKLGELLGVNALLVTYIVPTGSDEVSKATFRLVDVETAQVLFSTTFINAAGDKKTGGAVSTKEIIEALSRSVEKILQGEKKYSVKMKPYRNPNGSLAN